MRDLGASTRFYAWLLNTWPKEWTHRYATFIRPDLNLNFVIMVADGKDLHQDTLYHLGVALPDRAAVIDAHHRTVAVGGHVEKPPRTTWKGTPLHELWLTDPDGTLIEFSGRLTAEELAATPRPTRHRNTSFTAPNRRFERTEYERIASTASNPRPRRWRPRGFFSLGIEGRVRRNAAASANDRSRKAAP